MQKDGGRILRIFFFFIFLTRGTQKSLCKWFQRYVMKNYTNNNRDVFAARKQLSPLKTKVSLDYI